MKKTILYLSLVSTLAVLPTVGMEDEREGAGNFAAKGLNFGGDERVAQLERDLESMTQKKAQQEKDIADLRKRLSEKAEKQAETNNLLEYALRNGCLPEAEVGELSFYQQQLFSQREQKKIGDKAWVALRGNNPKLATALFRSIKGCPSETIVDIFYLGANNFTLLINGKVQDQPYKF